MQLSCGSLYVSSHMITPKKKWGISIRLCNQLRVKSYYQTPQSSHFVPVHNLNLKTSLCLLWMILKAFSSTSLFSFCLWISLLYIVSRNLRLYDCMWPLLMTGPSVRKTRHQWPIFTLKNINCFFYGHIPK